jgi:hypothetical protein
MGRLGQEHICEDTVYDLTFCIEILCDVSEHVIPIIDIDVLAGDAGRLSGSEILAMVSNHMPISPHMLLDQVIALLDKLFLHMIKQGGFSRTPSPIPEHGVGRFADNSTH